ncbi:MAG TPA: glycosyltransferase [Vicinamibacterales bacterium]|nr:glycosyltransferase [Vicinamibacterales bacterium]
MNSEEVVPRLRLVVPCHNEARRLRPAAFLEFVRATPHAALLFVDDGSADATRAVLDDLAEAGEGRIAVLALDRNRGKAEAVRQGVNAALRQRPQFVAFWDADLSTPLDAVREFEAVFDERPGLEMVIGARVNLLGRQIRRRMPRHYLGRLFATAASMALGMAVYDTQCGAKMFRATDVVARLFASPFEVDWVFDVELLARYIEEVGAEAARARIFELPLEEWSDVPGSKIRARHGVRALWDLAKIARAVRRRQR